MGALQAAEMAELVDIDTGLAWHLQYNHYPPVPLSMVGPCKRAIEKARREQWLRRVRLPEGVTWRGQSLVPAWVVVEDLHLDAWI